MPTRRRSRVPDDYQRLSGHRNSFCLAPKRMFDELQLTSKA